MSKELREITKGPLHEHLKISQKGLESILARPQDFYREFKIEINGKSRKIHPPIPPLKNLQRILLSAIYGHVRWLYCLHGGIPNRSVISNAQCHLGRHLVATYDISNFFPSTTEDMVRNCFISLKVAPELADTLTKLVTFSGSLPLGAPTSMAIANLVFKPSDIALLRLCGKFNLTYTRYVDDIAISGDYDFRDLSQAIAGNIEMLGYKVNATKINHSFSYQRQIVTGLVVNKVLSPTHRFITDTKTLIRRCRVEGPSIAADEHGLTINQLRQKIRGRISFVRSVNNLRGRELRNLLVGISWQERNSKAA